MAVGWPAETDYVCQFWSVATFCIKLTQNYFAFQIQNAQKNWLAHICLVGSHAFDQNGPPHGALITWDFSFFHNIYPLWIWILYRKILSQNWSNLGRLADFLICPFWPNWQTLHLPKQPTVWGSQTPKAHNEIDHYSTIIFNMEVSFNWHSSKRR